MSVMYKVLASADVAFETFDAMQPHALAWLGAMCGAHTVEAYLTWCSSRVALVASVPEAIIFIESARDGGVRIHPFVRPEARRKIAVFRGLARALLRDLGVERLVVAMTPSASPRVRALVRDVGFTFAGASATIETLPTELWTFEETQNG